MKNASSEAMHESRESLASEKVLVFNVLHDDLTEESQEMHNLGGGRSHMLLQLFDNTALTMQAISAAARLRPH